MQQTTKRSLARRTVASLGAFLLGAACAAPAHRSATERAGDTAPQELVGAGSAADSQLVAQIRAFALDRVATDSFSGVLLLARHDRPLYVLRAGVADRETGAAHRLDTRFNLGSLDKYFTRIAIRQLQQRGKLSTSDLVGKHLPDYPNQRVREAVTIQHLLQMTSGMGDFGTDNYRTYHARRLQLRTLGDYLSLFASDTLQFAPGSKTAYSNAGYVVLGLIIERVSGQSFYEYVGQEVLRPAGMRNSGYFTVDDRGGQVAVPYTTSAAAVGDYSEDAPKLQERRSAASLLAYRGSSAGGAYSTAEDLLKLAGAISGHRLLDAAYTDSLLRFRKIGPGQFDFDGWAGGSEGINTVFYMHSTGHVLIVLSNYDPPSAIVFRRRFWSDWLPEWVRKSG